MRLLITGAGGFVGGALVRNAPEEWEIHACTRGSPLWHRDKLTWHCFDLSKKAILEETLESIHPHVIIHAAAAADIDWCEANPREAEQVNVEVTHRIASFCKKYGTRLIFLSTDNVFNGVRGMYSETDIPDPVNHYGRTKVMAENVVMENVPSFVVARVALVIGFPLLGIGRSSMSRALAMFKQGKSLGVPTNEVRTPIDVVTLSKALLELAGHSFCGLLHLSGNDRLVRYDMMRRLAERLGFSPNVVYPNDPTGLPGRANRPLDVSLNNSLAQSLLSTRMLGFDDALETIVKAAAQ